MKGGRTSLGGYGSGLIAQAVTSGFHFGVNLALIKVLSLADYGMFALGFAVAVMSTAVTNALFAAPLSVTLPRLERAADGDELARVTDTLNLYVVGVLFVLAFGAAYGASEWLWTAAAFGCFVATSLVRFFYRGLAYARQRPTTALWMDIAYAGCGTAFLAIVLLLQTAEAATAFMVMAGASAVSAACGAIALQARPLLRSLPALWRGYRPLWFEARWALAGALVTTLQLNAHSLVVPLFFGTEALAPLAAGLILFGPISLCAQAIQLVLRPDLAKEIGAGRMAGAWRRVAIVTAVAIGAMAVFSAALAAAWPQVDALLFAGKYDTWPMGSIVALWAAVTVARLATVPVASLLQALRRFRLLAQITALGCGLTYALVVALAALAAPPTSVAGILVGDIAVAALIGYAALKSASRT